MKNLLKSIVCFLKNALNSFKSKLKQMIFNLLDATQELLGKWYYLEFTITDKLNDSNKYFFPLIACMRDRAGVMSLHNQIQKDLIYHFYVSTPEVIELTHSEKDLKIEQIESQLKNYKPDLLKVILCKPISKKKLPAESKLFNAEALQSGNKRTNVTYDEEVKEFKIGIIKNQGVPLHQIYNLFAVNIDTAMVDPSTDAPEPEKLQGGDIDRSKELIDKMNPNKSKEN